MLTRERVLLNLDEEKALSDSSEVFTAGANGRIQRSAWRNAGNGAGGGQGQVKS